MKKKDVAMPGPASRKHTLGSRDRRLLNRFKIIDGVKYQLHATKGWRKAK